MVKTGLSEEELAEYKKQVLGEHRGRKPKVPYETGDLRQLQKKQAAHAFVRLCLAAQSLALRKTNFTAWQDLNRWVYEIYHGRPKMAMEGEVKVPIQVTFTLAEAEGPKQLTKGSNDGSIEDRPADFADTDETD